MGSRLIQTLDGSVAQISFWKSCVRGRQERGSVAAGANTSLQSSLVLVSVPEAQKDPAGQARMQLTFGGSAEDAVVSEGVWERQWGGTLRGQRHCLGHPFYPQTTCTSTQRQPRSPAACEAKCAASPPVGHLLFLALP